MAVRRSAAEVAQQESGERLLIEAAQRDATKFGDLYEVHFERVYAYIARRLRDRDAAEDLTSEVFHKALAGLRNYEPRGAPFAAWLLRIAANAVIDYLKRSAREVTRDEDAAEPSVSGVTEELEERARLFRLVGQLPADQRQVVFQRFVEQRSIKEIAQLLGRTEGAVKQLQFRALQNLRARMEGAHG